MSAISIRMSTMLLSEADSWAAKMHITRVEYIRMSIEYMNQRMSLLDKKKRLTEASFKVRDESMRINEAFSQVEYDPKD